MATQMANQVQMTPPAAVRSQKRLSARSFADTGKGRTGQ
jgi:hypothetical protein